MKHRFLKLRSILLSHWRAKLISFLTALIFWLNVGSNVEIVSKIIPIEYRDLPKKYVLYPKPEESVRVKFKAKKGVIEQIDFTNLKFLVDLGNIKEGEYSLPRIFDPPLTGLNIEWIVVDAPENAELTVDILMKWQAFPVKPDFDATRDLKFAEGYTIDSYDFQPKQLMVQGPSKLLADFKEVDTMPLVIGQPLDQDRSIFVRAKLPNHFKDDVTIQNEDQVEISIKVIEKTIQSSFQRVKVYPKANQRLKNIILKPAYLDEVIVEGPYFAVNNLTSDQLFPYINLQDLNNFKHAEVPVIMEELGQGVRFISLKPDKVIVDASLDR